jgi:hypothetical protein
MSLKVLTMIIVASGILAGHSEQAPTARLRTHTQGQGDEDIQTKGRDLKQEVEVSMSMISNNEEMSLFGDGRCENGYCGNPTDCCSEWGYCGTGCAYCGGCEDPLYCDYDSGSCV